MNNFFDINSVAIVWASSENWKIGNSLLLNLANFSWEKYWVNPKWWEYNWIKFYDSINNLPIIPDVLVFAIPSKFVISSLEEAWKKWVKRVIVISAWFKEVWNYELEQELIEVSKKYNILLLWPNCLGYVDTLKNLNLSFGTKTLKSCVWDECKNIAIISQSWAMAVALTDWASSKKLWFSKLISMWNKAWVDENNLLEELWNDDNTKVISLYLESIEKWEKFHEITKKISKKVPIVMVKSWVSDRWSLAASSHTWALASWKDILETAFKDSWIHFTQSLEDFFLFSQIFSKADLDNIPEELVIITNAWWPWVMATDHTDFFNVKLAEFTETEKVILKEWLPESASVNNPVDIIGDATSKTYSQILNNVQKLSKKRAILILLTAQSVTDVDNIANVIIDFKRNNPDQFLMISFMWWALVENGRNIMNQAWLLEYDYPRKAIMCYSKLLEQKKWQEKPLDEEVIFNLPNNLEYLKSELQNQSKFATNDLTWEILDSFWINYWKEILVNSEEEVKKAFKEIWSSIVARISSPDIPHKSDIWGVILDIKTEEDAIKSYNKILENVKNNASNAFINWITFSKMIHKTASTRDIFVWFKRDVSFWNIIIVWMGWIYVNVIEDVTRRLWIISKSEILNMLKELKSYPILQWVRWEKSINFDALIDNIFKLQFVFNELPEIQEIDINPIFASEIDSIVLDAKFYL